MKKILLILIAFLFSFSSVSALTLCDNTELPDLPVEVDTDYDYVIVRTTSNRYRLYSFSKDSDVVASISSNTLSIRNNDSSNSITYYQTNSAGTSWSNLGSNNSGYTVTDVVVIATTVDITDNGNVIYKANYNLVCVAEERMNPMIEIIEQLVNEIISFTPKLIAFLLFMYLIGYMFMDRRS